MKVTVETAEEKEIEYPCLMRGWDEEIVYMISYGEGVDVRHGEYSKGWAMDLFIPLAPSEKVILQN